MLTQSQGEKKALSHVIFAVVRSLSGRLLPDLKDLG